MKHFFNPYMSFSLQKVTGDILSSRSKLTTRVDRVSCKKKVLIQVDTITIEDFIKTICEGMILLRDNNNNLEFSSFVNSDSDYFSLVLTVHLPVSHLFVWWL